MPFELARLRPDRSGRNYAEAPFAYGEWWRRGESNSRPQWSHSSFYARVLSIDLAIAIADRQAIPTASVHEICRHAARSLYGVTRLLSSPRPPSRC